MKTGMIAARLRATSRVRRLMNRKRLALIIVGAMVSEDRHVPEFLERDGATVRNPEYSTLLRELVAAVMDSL